MSVALFLDLKAAFDKVDKYAGIVKLQRLRVRVRQANLVANCLSDRCVYRALW